MLTVFILSKVHFIKCMMRAIQLFHKEPLHENANLKFSLFNKKKSSFHAKFITNMPLALCRAIHLYWNYDYRFPHNDIWYVSQLNFLTLKILIFENALMIDIFVMSSCEHITYFFPSTPPIKKFYFPWKLTEAKAIHPKLKL